MANKKLGSIIISIFIAAAIGTTAWAATAGTAAGNSGTADERRGSPKISEEQKAEMQAQRKAEKEAWAALSDEKKESIYSINEQIAALQNQLVDKYNEYGLIDKDEATKIKDANNKYIEEIKNGDKIPMLCGGGKGGFGAGRQTKAGSYTADETESSTADTASN
ncbi:MAG: DUF2680 domain-containing protein [Bacillota bacterium]|nr:DUF2680 domain-containing protein [Bacillota bacterium]